MSTKQKIVYVFKNPTFYLLITYILMILSIFIFPFYSFKEYSIIRNTTSQLGAQNAPNAWIMNLTFTLLGVTSIINGENFLGRYTIKYTILEDKLHSLFATITSISFTILAISVGFIEKNKKNQILAIISGMLAMILSILMFKVEIYMGIRQRMIFIYSLFIYSFGWMIYAFKKHKLMGGINDEY